MPTPSIYALWSGSVNLIMRNISESNAGRLFLYGQKRTEGVPFGFTDASSAWYHTRGWETVTVLSSSNLFPLLPSSLQVQPVLGGVWYV